MPQLPLAACWVRWLESCFSAPLPLFRLQRLAEEVSESSEHTPPTSLGIKRSDLHARIKAGTLLFIHSYDEDVSSSCHGHRLWLFSLHSFAWLCPRFGPSHRSFSPAPPLAWSFPSRTFVWEVGFGMVAAPQQHPDIPHFLMANRYRLAAWQFCSE